MTTKGTAAVTPNGCTTAKQVDEEDPTTTTTATAKAIQSTRSSQVQCRSPPKTKEGGAIASTKENKKTSDKKHRLIEKQGKQWIVQAEITSI